MSMRQIRIACCGMVVSTRPFPDTADIDVIADDIRDTARALLPYGKVAAWVEQNGVAHIVGRWT
jgi:hypothetical protein